MKYGKQFILSLLILIASCSPTKHNKIKNELLTLNCDTLTVEEVLQQSGSVYSAVARENFIEALIYYEIRVAGGEISISILNEKYITKNKDLNEEKYKQLNVIFTNSLTRTLKSSCGELKNGDYQIKIAYKTKNTSFNPVQHSYDILIEKEEPKFIQINSH